MRQCLSFSRFPAFACVERASTAMNARNSSQPPDHSRPPDNLTQLVERLRGLKAESEQLAADLDRLQQEAEEEAGRRELLKKTTQKLLLP